MDNLWRFERPSIYLSFLSMASLYPIVRMKLWKKTPTINDKAFSTENLVKNIFTFIRNSFQKTYLRDENWIQKSYQNKLNLKEHFVFLVSYKRCFKGQVLKENFEGFHFQWWVQPVEKSQRIGECLWNFFFWRRWKYFHFWEKSMNSKNIYQRKYWGKHYRKLIVIDLSLFLLFLFKQRT